MLTCELQRAAQRAVCWRQQGEAGVFAIRVLQTLHQRDGCVLYKLHQQLKRINIVIQQRAGNELLYLLLVVETHYLWLGVKLIRKHGSPFAEPVEQHSDSL